MLIFLIIAFTTSWAVIAYTYIAFPLVIALLSWASRGNGQSVAAWPEETLPTVAVVVAAYNEQLDIAAKVQNTWQIDYPAERLTLLIGSDGSSDSTPKLLTDALHPRLTSCLFSQRRGKVSVLNDLMAKVDADIVVLSDANTLLAPDAVRKLVRHFQNEAVGCVNGALSIEHNGGVSGEGLYWKYELWLKTQESRLGFVIGCYGGILAIRRELYTPIPATTIVEDFVLTMRIMAMNRIVRFDPEARATEPASASSRAEWGRKVRIGAGDYQALGLTRQMLHPRYGLRAFAYWSHKVLRWFVPFFLVFALLANFGIVLLGHHHCAGVYGASLGLQIAGILVAAIAYRLPAGSGPPSWLRPISFFYLMNFALLCGFFRWLRGRQPVTWQQAARQTTGEVS